jgi:uncharacterized SAM-binding protein YcdF (DUF218 family)
VIGARVSLGARRRWRRLLAVILWLPFPAFALAVAAADRLLVVRTAVRRADALVVLGGDWPRRGSHAVALFEAGLAPRILASGVGECGRMRRLMIEKGVPPEAITVECASRSTIENAASSAPILFRLGVRSALIVTDWFHTRRALACFQKEVPGVRWMTAPVERDERLWDLISDHNGVAVAEEYLKLAFYGLRYRVSPFPETGERRGANRQ